MSARADIAVTVVVAWALAACGQKAEEVSARKRLAADASAGAEGAPAAPTPGPGAPAEEAAGAVAPPVERHTFAKMPLSDEASSADWPGFRVSRRDGARIVFADAAGRGRVYSEDTETLASLELSLPVATPAQVFAIGPEAGWLFLADALVAADGSQALDTFELPASRLSYERLFGGAMPADARVVSVTDDALALTQGDDLLVVSRHDGGLRSERVAAPLATKDVLAAGFVASSEEVWVLSASALHVLAFAAEARVWRAWAVELAAPAGATIDSVGAQVVRDEATGGYRLAGAVYATSDQGPLWSETGEVVGAEARRLSWNANVRAVADQICVQCHAELAVEDTWWAKKDEVSRRLAVASKGAAFSMPPTGTVPAQSLTDAQRAVILQWLAQGKDSSP